MSASSHIVSLAFVNARIRTGDARRPHADAVAVSGRILALVGSSAEIRKLAGAGARIVDVKGAAICAHPRELVLQRGGAASFVVLAPDSSATERFRMLDGEIVFDILTN